MPLVFGDVMGERNGLEWHENESVVRMRWGRRYGSVKICSWI